MRPKALLLPLLTLLFALSLSADDRHQSYVSYDDGGTVVRSGGERDQEAHRNLPIYPGDEIETARRGRAEVMLSDGNIIGLDRASAVLFRSILDSYEGDSSETVAELKFGKVAVHRTDIGRQHVRLDTAQASYVATHEAVYSVETESRGRDRVMVFDGSVEVRTPSRSTRLRRGEAATVDEQGVYDLVGNQLASADDFERWFLKRAERFGSYNNKYLDRRLSYYSDDLDSHGRWVFLTGIGWSWRPYVEVGWRPYHRGYWHTSRWGALTWVSYDPWGWGPYHYGRWAFDPGWGWVWVPGYSYSPAWVYWMYGPGYVGWAPSGWWDCHPRYYDWAYRPYRRAGYDIGFGFHGRIRVSDIDLRPWTFVDSNTIFTNRVDRAALTTDVIKNRLNRNGNGTALVSGGAARFTREELRNPSDAIRRRSLGDDKGSSTGANTDLTPFMRRDPNIGASVRDRIVRSRGTDPVNVSVSRGNNNTGGGSVAPIPSGGLAPIGRGSVAPIDGGNVAPIGRGSVAPIGGTDPRTVDRGDAGTAAPTRRDPVVIGRDRDRNDDDGSTGAISRRGAEPSTGSGSSTSGGSSSSGSWRERINNRGGNDQPRATAPATGSEPSATPRDHGAVAPRENPAPARERATDGGSSWRNRRSAGSGDSSPSSGSSRSSGSSIDVPARVIDGIGGARTIPRSSGRDSGSRDSGSSTRGSNSGERERPRSYDRPSRSSGGSDSGSSSSTRRSSDGGGSSRSSGGGSSTRSSDGGGSSRSSSGGGNRESGGRIKRDN